MKEKLNFTLGGYYNHNDLILDLSSLRNLEEGSEVEITLAFNRNFIYASTCRVAKAAL